MPQLIATPVVVEAAGNKDGRLPEDHREPSAQTVPRQIEW